MPDNLYLGLDNTQPNVLRALYLLTERPFSCSVLKWGRCKDLPRFQEFVSHFAPTIIAVSTVSHDPFGAISWLAERRSPIQRHPTNELLNPFYEKDELDLPKTYRRAYSLAYQAAYQFEAPRALEALWHEMHWAKSALERMERDFNRLMAQESIAF